MTLIFLVFAFYLLLKFLSYLVMRWIRTLLTLYLFFTNFTSLFFYLFFYFPRQSSFIKIFLSARYTLFFMLQTSWAWKKENWFVHRYCMLWAVIHFLGQQNIVISFFNMWIPWFASVEKLWILMFLNKTYAHRDVIFKKELEDHLA